jgi:hypothetical protein
MAMLIIKSVVYINLLYLANQFGRKISKLSLVEAEYFPASNVTGQMFLKISSIIPSTRTRPMQIQSHRSILPMITAYSI